MVLTAIPTAIHGHPWCVRSCSLRYGFLTGKDFRTPAYGSGRVAGNWGSKAMSLSPPAAMLMILRTTDDLAPRRGRGNLLVYSCLAFGTDAHPGRLSLGGRRRRLGVPDRRPGPANCSTRIHKDQRAARTHLADPPAPDRPRPVTRSAASSGNYPRAKRRRHRPEGQLELRTPNQPSRRRLRLGLGGGQDHLVTSYLLHINDDPEQSSSAASTGSQRDETNSRPALWTGQCSMMKLG
jgi:hypothetical protein